MSETMSAVIRIGGHVPRRLVPALCRCLADERLVLEKSDEFFEPHSAEDLLAARTEYQGHLVLELHDDQATWGHFESLESFLEKHRVPFDRQTDGKWEYDPHRLQFRPGRKPLVTITDSRGQPVMAASHWDPLRQMVAQSVGHFDAGSMKTGVRLVRRLQRWLISRMPPEASPLPTLQVAVDAPASRRRTGHHGHAS